MRVLLVLSLFMASGWMVVADQALPARLLVEKQVLNKFLVETRDVLINFNIYNVGESAALNVQVQDSSFPYAHFDLIQGSPKFTIARIAPQSNASHSLVIQSKENVWGRFNFTSAEVTYQSEGSSELLSSISSEPGEGYIVSHRDFERRFSSHLSDWVAFALLSLSTVLFPYLLWNNSKNKYEALSLKKSK